MKVFTLGFLTANLTISKRKMIAVAILIASTLVWFFFLDTYFDEIFSPGQITPTDIAGGYWITVGKSLFLGSAAFSAIIGSIISEKVERRKFLYLWIAFGALVAGSLAVFQGLSFFLFVSVLLGISLGLGFPSCIAFLADSTTPEERGRVSGVTILATFLVVFPVVAIPPLLGFGLTAVILLCLIRIAGFAAFFLDPIKREKGKGDSWLEIFSNKEFAYYIFPWLMVNIADGLRLLIWGNFQVFPEFNEIVQIGYYIRYLGVGFFSFVAGVASDRIGRKTPIIIGLILMGVSFAFLGYMSTISLFLFLILSGVAWSFLFVVYFSVLGDLASKFSKERFYALGWITPISILMGFSSLAGVFYLTAPLSFVSPILSIILFLTIIPILVAEETLPKAKIRKRRLREHTEKVGKLVQESRRKK